jgi:hypothetical protein
MPHDIRLAGPWEYSVDDGSTWDRCTLPFDASSHCGTPGETTVRLRRRFHRPSGLDQSSAVSIIVLADAKVAQIGLNDHGIVATTVEGDAEQTNSVTSHFHVSKLLDEFNTLQVTLGANAQSLASAINATGLRIEDN